MSIRKKLGIAAIIVFLVTLALIGSAEQQPEKSQVKLAAAGLSAHIGEKHLDVTLPIEKLGTLPFSGWLQVTLLDITGKKIAGVAKEVHLLRSPTKVEMGLDADIDPVHPERYILAYNFQSRSGNFSGRTSLYNLAAMLETRVLGPSEVMAGSDASIRVLVRDMNKRAAIQGAKVTISLAEKVVFTGQTDSEGTVSPTIAIPDEPGSAKLLVRVEAQQGTDAYESSMKIKRVERVLLVTDKPLYQPSQQMHLRAMALHEPDLKPLEGREVIFEVEDAKGNKVFKHKTKTDSYGISSAIFTLANEVNMGEYKIRAILGENTKIEKTVTVARYVLPKFKIAFESDKPFYMPGKTVKASLNVNYFFGKPVAKSAVKVTAGKFDVNFQAFSTIEGKTDQNGHYSFELNLPDYFVGEPLEQGKARVKLELSVTDGSGHEEVKTAWLTVAKAPLILDAIPESGSLVKGVPNQIYVMASQPGGEPAKVEFHDSISNKWVSSDDFGIAILTVTPRTDTVDFTLQARDSSGNKVSRSFKFGSAGQQASILLRADRAIYRAGDYMKVAVLSALDGTAYIDLIQEGQTLHTAWTDIRNGAGELTMQAPMNAQGSAILHAYRLTPTGTWLRSTRRIFIEPATELTIDVRPGKQTYLPAEEASIDFFVKDRLGNPVAAALGIQVVDESVFALQEMQPGLEKVYFLLEEELSKPRYEIHGFSIPGIISGGAEGQPVPAIEKQARKDRLGMVLLAAAHTEMEYGIVADTADARRVNMQQAMNEYMQAVAKKVVEAGNKYRTKHHKGNIQYEDAVNHFISQGYLKSDDILDPWGNNIRITGSHPYPVLVSAGPDGKFGTDDDISFEMYIPRPMFAFDEEDRVMAAPPAGAARGGVRMKAAMPMQANGAPKNEKKRNGGGGLAASEAQGGEGQAEEPRIRSYFPETLWVEPSLITDGNGHAIAKITMADSITTWRLTAMANSKKGALGSTSHGIRVFQEFFVDINLPVALTRNDRITIPVAVYNYLPNAQTVRLEMTPENWFEIMGSRTQTVKLEKDEVKGVGFDVRVKDVGSHTITVKAYGSNRSDAVQRTVDVLPDGEEIVANFNGRLKGRAEHEFSFPGEAVPGANRLFVKVYPGLLSQVVEGLDSIFQMPGGCFEQTSSTTYPNVLVLDYIQKAGKITPELKMKAEGFINNGYQRLLTFEVRGGGFEWFGQSPAHIVLTAYGLMEFSDMSKVYSVDPALIKRTQEWLVSQQQANGSWKPNQRVLDTVASRFTSDVLRNTAYVAWSLSSSGYTGGGLNKAIGYLKENMKDAKDLYTKALILMALASNDPKDQVAKDLLEKILEQGVVKGGAISFTAGADTAVHSTGDSADVETTALIGLALMRMDSHREVVDKIIAALIEKKDQRGTWYSTQATVLALKTLIGSLGMATEAKDAEVVVSVDGKDMGRFSLKGSNSEILQLKDLSELATTGKHKVSLRVEGEGNTYYSVVARTYIPWDRLPPQAKAPMAITVTYDKRELATNDVVSAKITAQNLTPAIAHMVILDLGIPPGFEVQTEDLDKYVENHTIQRYNMTGRQIIVYLDKINAKSTVELTYRLKATMPMKAQTFASRIYEYYNPAREAFSKPVGLVVK